MPKLAKDKAKKVAENEGSGFEALPEAIYPVRLTGVTVGEGDKGPYWTWELEVDGDPDYDGRKLWCTTSLSDAADWKLKEVFEAFGYTTDSDTDEMIGEKCKASVSQRVITKGARAGQTGNNVDTMIALTAEEAEGGEDDDETF